MRLRAEATCRPASSLEMKTSGENQQSYPHPVDNPLRKYHYLINCG